MGLFFKKKEVVDNSKNVLYAPLEGKVVPIESLNDKTFADKVMGDGIAIVPTVGKLYAPVSGTISALLDTHHAYGITTNDGYDVLIHIGQDTVKLNGEHFTCHVKEDQHVNKGDLLCTFDIDAIKAKGYDVSTPVILIAGSDYEVASKTQLNEVKVGDELLSVKK